MNAAGRAWLQSILRFVRAEVTHAIFPTTKHDCCLDPAGPAMLALSGDRVGYSSLMYVPVSRTVPHRWRNTNAASANVSSSLNSAPPSGTVTSVMR